MGSSKFIQKIKTLFGFEADTPDAKKKQTIKELLKKLKMQHIELKKALKDENDLVKRQSIHDSINILKKQIKKGKDIIK